MIAYPGRASLASFDSAGAMVRVLARALAGREGGAFGTVPGRGQRALQPLGRAINAMPARRRERLYSAASGAEGIAALRLGRVSAERIAAQVASSYGRRRYQAVAIGSTSGALIDLCAALRAPFLPQTALIPVRHPGLHVDEPRDGLEFGREPAERLLAANPELQLHHMWDPNHDRLTLARLAYFRVKWRQLADAYRRFLERSLEPGGVLIVSDCRLRWPVHRFGPRRMFQFGALGGATVDELHHGSERVEAHLERHGSHRRRWEPHPPETRAPEAEWGFEPALSGDLLELARIRRWRIRRLSYEEPEAISPLVAALYRRWNERRGVAARRLVVGSFVLLDPWWTLRLGAEPLWLAFSVEPSLRRLESHLDSAGPYDEVHAALFNHGVDAVGVPPGRRWAQAVGRGARHGRLLGVDPERFPRDLAHFLRIRDALREIPARYPMPAPLSFAEVDRFLGDRAPRYGVEWADDWADPE